MVKVNKLSLNINKTEYMVFSTIIHKKVNKPDVMMDNVKIERVDSFNFFGIILIVI